MLKKFFFIALFSFLTLTFPFKAFAAGNAFITVVNPVRVSTYNEHPEKSLAAEYEVIKKRQLSATWLVTYDVLKNPEMMKALASFDENQEIGIFLEVTSGFANDSGVKFNLSDSWHRARSLFLTGYLQEDRKKLIDRVFDTFKKELGYYPTSVGSWWIDSYSLEYMQRKYSITAGLTVSDQMSLDGYTVWGTYYSTPYYPSKINTAIPAGIINEKTDVVMQRWAARDPLNGFKSPSGNNAAMYSIQDYDSIGLPDTYFESLAKLYAEREPYNNFAHLTLGLESDLSADSYESILGKRLDIAERLSAEIVSMKDFADWYRSEYKELSPPQLITTDDLLGSAKKIFWYQRPEYRVGMIYDSQTKQLVFSNLVPYYQNFMEPFYRSPNRQNGLYIVNPYITDSVIEPELENPYECGDYISAQKNQVKFESCDILFGNTSIKVNGEEIAANLPGVFSVDPEGESFNTIGFEINYALLRRLPLWFISLSPFIALAFIVILFFYLFNTSSTKVKKIAFIITAIVLVLFFATYQKVHISQSEIEALKYLFKQPAGKVIVFDKDCLNCSYQTQFKPAAMTGYRDYIARASGKPMEKSLVIPLAKSPGDIKNELERTDAVYIYLLKYEDYVEEVPYSLENVGLKVIFENANVQILKTSR